MNRTIYIGGTLATDQAAFEVDEKGDAAETPLDPEQLVGWTITSAKVDDVARLILSLHRPG